MFSTNRTKVNLDDVTQYKQNGFTLQIYNYMNKISDECRNKVVIGYVYLNLITSIYIPCYCLLGVNFYGEKFIILVIIVVLFISTQPIIKSIIHSDGSFGDNFNLLSLSFMLWLSDINLVL